MKPALSIFDSMVPPRFGTPVARPAFAALLLAASFLLLHARPGLAGSTFYVDTNNPGADDRGEGTPEVPFKTVSAAVKKKSGPGVTILVRPGIYFDEHVTI